MTVETFFEKFELFADVPGVVTKMRELVLEFAVTGRLSEYQSSDASISEFIEALSNGKARFSKNGRRGNIPIIQKEYLNIRPYNIPTHWAWVPLNKIGTISGGMTPSKDKSRFWNGDVNWFSSKDIKTNELTDAELKITREAVRATGLQVYPPGCLVMVARSGILKRTFPVSILKVEGTVNQDLKVLSPFVDGIERYLQIMLRGMTRYILTSLVKTGMTVQSLKYEEFETQVFPIPPLAEQKRIVAKVDELMALCDRLEAQQQKRETRHAALAHASLARFADAPTPANINFIFHKSYNIPPADLRKSILTLAVQGKLVPQDPSDEPGEAILKRIHSGILAKETGNGTTVGGDLGELSFCLPPGWSVSRLGSILIPTRGISYGVIKLGAEPQKDGVFILRCSNVRFRRIDLNGIRKITEQLSCEYGRTILEGGEVLINVRGTLGGCAVVPPELKGYNIAREVAVIPAHNEIDPNFLLNVIASPYFQDKVDDNLRGIAYEGLNLGLLRDFLVPIPPHAEQRRIVAKVDELMALVDELETQLAASRAVGEKLLAALVAELTAGKEAHAAT